MKLTNEQRLIVYKALLKRVCKDPSVKEGMCRYLNTLLDNSKKLPSEWVFYGGVGKMSALPELNANRNNKLYWAPRTKEGWKLRIKWIEKAIIEVQNKIKNHEN